jgi:hypothetical protein
MAKRATMILMNLLLKTTLSNRPDDSFIETRINKYYMFACNSTKYRYFNNCTWNMTNVCSDIVLMLSTPVNKSNIVISLLLSKFFLKSIYCLKMWLYVNYVDILRIF